MTREDFLVLLLTNRCKMALMLRRSCRREGLGFMDRSSKNSRQKKHFGTPNALEFVLPSRESCLTKKIRSTKPWGLRPTADRPNRSWKSSVVRGNWGSQFEGCVLQVEPWGKKPQPMAWVRLSAWKTAGKKDGGVSGSKQKQSICNFFLAWNCK